jgi:hypothetical protein
MTRTSSFISGLLLGETAREIRRARSVDEPVTSEPIPVEAIAGKVLTEIGELTAVVDSARPARSARSKVMSS